MRRAMGICFVACPPWGPMQKKITCFRKKCGLGVLFAGIRVTGIAL
jgi:hypothetical protein